TMLVVVMLLLVLLQAGCTEFTAEDKAFVRSLVQEYLESKDMSPTNPDGTIDYLGGARFGLAMIGRSNDEEANALFGIVTSVGGVIEADKAMDEARANGDAAKMDEVIASRPGDWSYRSSRAVLALAQGDMETYRSQSSSFSDIANSQGVPPGRQARQVIEDFRTIPVPDTGEQCIEKYLSLTNAYNVLYGETGEQKWLDMAAETAAIMQNCS
ncbi:MAG: hypothetical protein ACYCYF_09675, partial [Anaerolineae bacterium]